MKEKLLEAPPAEQGWAEQCPGTPAEAEGSRNPSGREEQRAGRVGHSRHEGQSFGAGSVCSCILSHALQQATCVG